MCSNANLNISLAASVNCGQIELFRDEHVLDVVGDEKLRLVWRALCLASALCMLSLSDCVCQFR